MVDVVRAPASSANLGAGFDVFGLAIDLYADVGRGPVPDDAVALDEHHPATRIHGELGGRGPIWLRTSIPMARGLGFSGAVRVAAAALAVTEPGSDSGTAAIAARRGDLLAVVCRHEGHGDNAAASLFGGVTVFRDGAVLPLRVGPALAAASVVAWIPTTRTSTDRSRGALSAEVPRSAAVANIARAVQFALAVERDDPELLEGATVDRLHQAERLRMVPDGAAAIEAGGAAGAWCAWLSGSGPTVAMLVPADRTAAVVGRLPTSGHVKVHRIDRRGVRCDVG